MTRRAWLLAGFAALAACASLPPRRPAAAPGLELLEPILGFRADARGVTIRVRSGDCTARADFAFYIERTTGVTTIAFGRRRVDACRGSPEVLELSWSYQELGLAAGAPLSVANPTAPYQ